MPVHENRKFPNGMNDYCSERGARELVVSQKRERKANPHPEPITNM